MPDARSRSTLTDARRSTQSTGTFGGATTRRNPGGESRASGSAGNDRRCLMAPQSLGENQPVPHEWRRWAAESWLREVSKEEIAQLLHEHGFTTEHELAAIAAHPYVEAGEWIAQRLRKLESILDVYSQLASLAADPTTVDRRRDLTREEFLVQYYSRNRPVIIDGLLDHWPALTRWTPAYLRSVCGEAVVEV